MGYASECHNGVMSLRGTMGDVSEGHNGGCL